MSSLKAIEELFTILRLIAFVVNEYRMITAVVLGSLTASAIYWSVNKYMFGKKKDND